MTDQCFNVIRSNHFGLHAKAIFVFAIVYFDVTRHHNEDRHIVLYKRKGLRNAFGFATDGRCGILDRGNPRFMVNNLMRETANSEHPTCIF